MKRPATPTNHTEGDRTRKRTLAGGLAAGLAPIALVLLISTTAVGVSPALHVIKAPYKNAFVVLKNPSALTGCGGGGHLAKAFFNKTSGIGGFSDNASTKWCTSSTNNSAIEKGSFALTVPFKVKTNGTHTITALWLTVAFGSVNLTAGTCTGSATVAYTGCTRSASAFVYGSAYLYDKTTGLHTKLSNKWVGNSTYVSNYTSCIFTKCSSTASKMSSAALHTGNAYWAWYWNGTVLNASHNYSLKMTVFGGVSLILMTNGATLTGAHADAQLNSATLGNEEDLVSITVT